MNDNFLQLLAVRMKLYYNFVALTRLQARYLSVKSQFPDEGRRRWHLRVLEEFWTGPSFSTSILDVDALAMKQPLAPVS